ncbi:aldehyde dehydrogenase family protein [Flavobacterium sp. 3HN19-14]|uniref:aldehyde dehydrogenase family protein n=1 Tax=Flavobacterium sp. 3HN19-14 TaxID=3448133 RepID=UPI003EE1E139
MPIQTTNPYNNKVVKTFEEITDTELESKIAKAHQEFQQWRHTNVKVRAKLLSDVAAIMLRRKDELAALITLEMGKLIAQSKSEVEMCASVYQYYADHAERFLEDKPLEVKDGKAFVRFTPTGIILGVEP